MTPDFFVIGAYKCGTTALHHQLRAHPDLYLPARKEPNFFAFANEVAPFDHPAAAGSIRDHAQYEALYRDARPDQLRGDVSPAYLVIPTAADRLRSDAPAARLIAVLRNPVERAYSDYLMYRRDGLEDEDDFLLAIRRQDERDPASDPTSRYISTGFYHQQLRPFVEAFPPEQLCVILYEELAADLVGTLRRLYRFLGVPDDIALDPQVPSNVSGVPDSPLLRAAFGARRRLRTTLAPVVPGPIARSIDATLQRRLRRDPLPLEAREALIEIYRDDVERLGRLIDRDLSHWLAPTQRIPAS